MAKMALVSPPVWLLLLLLWGTVSSSLASFTFKTMEDFAVRGLEEIEPAFKSFEGEMYAGRLPIAHPSSSSSSSSSSKNKFDKEPGEYMFWLFEPKAPAVDDSLIVWFNGGPGCTAFSAGLFFEMGPLTVPLRPAGNLPGPDEVHAPLQYNPHGWHKASAVMYVEQPVNVGFSTGPNEPKDETDVGRALDGFLQQFVHVFEAYRDKRIFLVGESYAGMYVPSMAYYIHQQNKKRRPKDEYLLNLGGIGLGNGWVDAIVQGGTIIDYAWWHGMIDSVIRNDLQREWEHCKLKGKTEPAPFHSYTVPDECGTLAVVARAAGAGLLPRGLAPNMYDATTWDPYDLINKDDSTIPVFFNNKEIQKILNVPDDFEGPWMGCIPGAGRRRLEHMEKQREMLRHRALHLLDQDRPESMHDYMITLLDDAKIPVLVYNGDRDVTTNSVGSELFLDGLKEWSGAAAWQDPEQYNRGLWVPDPNDEGQAIGGYSKEVQNLMFVIVTNSGHLVPYNRPVAALDLITRLLQGKSFVDVTIDPILFEVPQVIQGDSEFKGSTIRHSHGRRWLEILVVTIMAFAAGYFASRLHHRKRDGYSQQVSETVPLVRR